MYWLYTVSQMKRHLFYCFDIFVRFHPISWQKQTTENLKQTCIHRPPHLIYMFVLYLVKQSCLQRASAPRSWHRGTSGLAHATHCGHQHSRRESSGLRRSVFTACPHSTLPIWRGAWLLHGLLCSSVSPTRQSTSDVDGCAPVWKLRGNTSNICFDNMHTVCLE